MTGSPERRHPVDERLDDATPARILARTLVERSDPNQEALLVNGHLDLELAPGRGRTERGGGEGQFVDSIDRKVEARAEAAQNERCNTCPARAGGDGQDDRIRHKTVTERRARGRQPTSRTTSGLRPTTLPTMPERDLTLTTDTAEGASIIHVVGELDLSTTAVFEAQLEQSLPSGRVVVVLAECTFVDSSALRSLVRAERAAREGGGGLAIVAPSQPARRVLEVSALDRVMPVFETVAEAVASPTWGLTAVERER